MLIESLTVTDDKGAILKHGLINVYDISKLTYSFQIISILCLIIIDNNADDICLYEGFRELTRRDLGTLCQEVVYIWGFNSETST